MKFQRSNERNVYFHVVTSHDHAKAGLILQAEHHRNKAHHFHQEHMNELTNAGYPENAKKFSSDMKPYLDKLDSVIQEAKKTYKPKSAIKEKILGLFRKSEIAEMTDEELFKALMMIPGTKSAKITTKVAADRQPGNDPRYSYKPFHELSHEDQVKATHAFQDKDMANHHYPVDKETGSFVHGATRWLQRNPTSAGSSGKSVVAPEHRAGAFVRISAEGSAHHGKTGIVKMPNAHFPGKVPVQVGLKDHEIEYFSPDQVKLNKSDQEDSPIEELVSKSRKVLASIKKGSE